jgi:hypothetical protein
MQYRSSLAGVWARRSPKNSTKISKRVESVTHAATPPWLRHGEVELCIQVAECPHPARYHAGRAGRRGGNTSYQDPVAAPSLALFRKPPRSLDGI